MDPIVTASLVSAGANVLGNLFNVFGQKSANSANMELARYQYEKNLEMWNRQNEYNLPIAQMARLRDAGINPVMAFSNGQVTGNVASNYPQYDRPQIAPYQVDSSGLAQIGASYIQARQAEQQIELMKSQQSLNDAKVVTENTVQLLKALQAVSEDQQIKYFDTVRPLLEDTVAVNKELLVARKDLTISQKNLNEGEIALIPLRASELIHRMAKMDSETRLNALQGAKVAVETAFAKLKAEYFADTTDEQKEYLQQQIEGLKKLNNIRDLESWLKDFNNSKADTRYKIEIISAIIHGISQMTGAGSNVAKIAGAF